MNNRHFHTVLLLGVASLSYYIYQKRKTIIRSASVKWEKVGEVEKLYIYPLEGGHKQETKVTYCTEYGLLQFGGENSSNLIDRSFVIYNEDTLNCEINLPNLNEMKLIMGHAEFQLNAPNKKPIAILLSSLKRQTLIVDYFGNCISVRDCGVHVARWLSEYLLGCSDGLRLGIHAVASRTFRCDEPTHTWLNPHCEWKYGFPRRKLTIPTETGKINEAKKPLMEMNSAFSTYSLISSASIEKIENTLEDENITGDFRPNILIKLEGDLNKPFFEDRFEWIKIGDAVFTDVVPNTATHLFLDEPHSTIDLKSLKLMKNCGFSDMEYPVVGINMEVVQRAVIKASDEVYVKYKQN